MNIIVIGATGYIGHPLLISAEKLYKAQGTSSGGSDTLLPFRLDCPEDFNFEVLQSSDVVFITAAISAPDICTTNREYAWNVNVTGTSIFIQRVLEMGARVVFFSSDTVYGERAEPVSDIFDCNPAGDYAVMKHAVEKRFLNHTNFKAIRLSYVFSWEDKFTKYLRNCMEANNVAEIFHPFSRATVHRNDVIQGALALAKYWDEIPQPIVNFGGPDLISRMSMARILKEIALPTLQFRQIDPPIEFFTNRPRTINMQSPLLPKLLNRAARPMNEAVRQELNHSESISK